MSATDRTPMPIGQWLTSLGAICAGSMSLAEARARVAALQAALAGEFDAQAFCLASVRHVARSSKFFPTFAEICEALSAWQQAQRPSSHLVALPSQAPGQRARESQIPYEPRAPRHLGRLPSRRRWPADGAGADGPGLRSVAEVLPSQQERPAHG